MPPTPATDDTWAAAQALADAVAHGRVVVAADDSCCYRPDQLIVSSRASVLLGGVPVDATDSTDTQAPWLDTLGLALWVFAPGTDMLARATTLKAQAYAAADPTQGDPDPVADPGQDVIRVSLNHVLVGAPHGRIGTPAGPPAAGPPVGIDGPPDRDAVDIAVLDTGVPQRSDLGMWHESLDAALRRDAGNPLFADDLDTLYVGGTAGVLRNEAGHGTFIAGLVRQVAPDLVISPYAVLDPDGFGDDVAITKAVLTLIAAPWSVPVLSMSFAGPTFDDLATPALQQALAQLPALKALAVAAAGNNADGRHPYWPAALPDVVAVAAVDDRTIAFGPTAFTNRGCLDPAVDWVGAAPRRWVDVCTWGQDVMSAYVPGLYPIGPGERDVVEFPARNPFARWSGTSFATPLVAAAVARQVREAVAAGHPVDAPAAWLHVRAQCQQGPGQGEVGHFYEPPVDVRG